MENFISQQKINAEKSLTLTSNEAVKQAVISDMGCSILPLIGIRNELTLGQLEIIETTGLPIENEWYLVHLKDKKLMPAAKAFKFFISENKEEIHRKYFVSK
jgi:DNA-binding transcriptional LysR family regulator